MKFNSRERGLIIAIIILVITAGLINFAVLPVWNLIEQTNNIIIRKSILLQRYRRLRGNAKAVEAFITDHKTALQDTGNNESMIFDLFSEIESIAGKYNVDIKWIKPQNPRRVLIHKEADMEMEIEGDFAGIFQSIAAMEISPSLIRIIEVKLSSQSGENIICRLIIRKIFF